MPLVFEEEKEFQRTPENSAGLRISPSNTEDVRRNTKRSDATRGTVTRHIELPATPLCREELQLEQVRIVDHASCLRRNLEGFHIVAINGGKATSSVLYLRILAASFGQTYEEPRIIPDNSAEPQERPDNVKEVRITLKNQTKRSRTTTDPEEARRT